MLKGCQPRWTGRETLSTTVFSPTGSMELARLVSVLIEKISVLLQRHQTVQLWTRWGMTEHARRTAGSWKSYTKMRDDESGA